jgi:hypothetical protein
VLSYRAMRLTYCKLHAHTPDETRSCGLGRFEVPVNIPSVLEAEVTARQRPYNLRSMTSLPSYSLSQPRELGTYNACVMFMFGVRPGFWREVPADRSLSYHTQMADGVVCTTNFFDHLCSISFVQLPAYVRHSEAWRQ